MTNEKYKVSWKKFDNALAVMSLGDFRNLFNPKTYEWQDCPKNGIPAFIKWLGYKKKTGEVESWINSWREMYKVLKDNKFSPDCWVILEYIIKPTNKRVDFILCGKDNNNVKKIIIVELKQWDKKFTKGPESGRKINLSNKDYKPLLHPSLQALGYKSLIKSYNKFVNDSNILIKSCAYLHNWNEDKENSNWLKDFYQNGINKSPLYDNQDDLKNFLLTQDDKAFSTLNNCEYNKIDSSKEIATNFLCSEQAHEDLINLFNKEEQFYLIDEQFEVAANIIDSIEKNKNDKNIIIVKGGPGSGKSAVALSVFNVLFSHFNIHKVKLAITSNAFRECLIKELEGHVNLASHITKTSKLWNRENLYDVVISDEAHRLKRDDSNSRNINSEIDKVLKVAKNCVFFVDDDQLIVPADEGTTKNIVARSKKFLTSNTSGNKKPVIWELTEQYRCFGSNEYINWIDKVLQINDTNDSSCKDIKNNQRINWLKYNFKFKVCKNIDEMFGSMSELDGDVRILTGQAWKDRVIPSDKDIPLDNYSSTWAIEDHRFDQAGTVHVVQGMEFDYVGVIIGNDLVYYKDTELIKPKTDQHIYLETKNGLNLHKPNDFKKFSRYLKSVYKILLTRGTKGCYVYCCDTNLNQRFKDCMPDSQDK